MAERDWLSSKIIAMHLNYRSRASDRGMVQPGAAAKDAAITLAQVNA